MLGAEVGEPPGAQAHHPLVAAPGEVGAIGEHQLHVLAQHIVLQRSLDTGQGMVRRGHGHQLHLGDLGAHQLVAPVGEGDHQADIGRVVQQGLHGGAQGLHSHPGLHGGELRLELGERLQQQAHGEHSLHHQGDLRLQPAGHAARLGTEGGHVAHDPLGPGQQGAAGLAEGGAIGAAVEQRNPGLLLEFLDGIGHRRLGSSQGAGGGGKAAALDDGEEDFELGQGGRIHDHQFY